MLKVTEKSQLVFTKQKNILIFRVFQRECASPEPAQPLVLGRYYMSVGTTQGKFFLNRVLVFLQQNSDINKKGITEELTGKEKLIRN